MYCHLKFVIDSVDETTSSFSYTSLAGQEYCKEEFSKDVGGCMNM